MFTMGPHRSHPPSDNVVLKAGRLDCLLDKDFSLSHCHFYGPQSPPPGLYLQEPAGKMEP